MPDAELWVSYLQIYCESISDLLTMDGNGAGINGNLQLRERSGEVFVDGLSWERVRNLHDLRSLLDRGDSNRFTASTNINETSSRSHAVLIAKIVSPLPSSDSKQSSAAPQKQESSLVLVDLAGSERAAASSGRGYMRVEEGKAINLSLSALGNCMQALAARQQHIPFRDSKLTRLLQGSLGGRSRTSVIIALSTWGQDESGQGLQALRFGARATQVRVRAAITRVIDYEALYNQLQIKLDTKTEECIQQSLLREQESERAEQLRNELESARLVLLDIFFL